MGSHAGPHPGGENHLQQRQTSQRHLAVRQRAGVFQALLVQFPHQDAWTIAFLTGKPGPGVAEHLNGDYVSVYVPTTPTRPPAT